EEALPRLVEVSELLDRHPVTLSWYWRLPLQLDLTEAWLASGDLKQARAEADRGLELTGATAERTSRSLAYVVSAHVARREQDRHREESDLQKALTEIHGFDVPLAAWRVNAAIARMYRENGESDLAGKHLEAARVIVRSLADSLPAGGKLQQSFLGS